MGDEQHWAVVGGGCCTGRDSMPDTGVMLSERDGSLPSTTFGIPADEGRINAQPLQRWRISTARPVFRRSPFRICKYGDTFNFESVVH